jgi:hypothetical protein
MQKLWIFLTACILCVSVGARPAQAQTQGLVLGVNASMGSLSIEQQNAILGGTGWCRENDPFEIGA